MRLRRAARESLRYRKRTQPLAEPSAGCIFRNPDPDLDPVPAGLPGSAGALVDATGLKNRSVGRAHVSERHANFIVTDGTASTTDIRTLIEECRAAVQKRFGVVLRDEIVYLGGVLTDQLNLQGQASTAAFSRALVVDGGHRLGGTLSVEGNKNAALPLLAACVLTDEPCELRNVPRITDVGVMIELLRGLGADVVDDGGDHAEGVLSRPSNRRTQCPARRTATRVRICWSDRSWLVAGVCVSRRRGATSRRGARSTHIYKPCEPWALLRAATKRTISPHPTVCGPRRSTSRRPPSPGLRQRCWPPPRSPVRPRSGMPPAKPPRRRALWFLGRDGRGR